MSDRNPGADLGAKAETAILTLDVGVAKDLYQALSLALGPEAVRRKRTPETADSGKGADGGRAKEG